MVFLDGVREDLVEDFEELLVIENRDSIHLPAFSKSMFYG
jgi:hypothetical protein